MHHGSVHCSPMAGIVSHHLVLGSSIVPNNKCAYVPIKTDMAIRSVGHVEQHREQSCAFGSTKPDETF